MRHIGILLAALLLGCGVRPERAALLRRPIAPRAESGWARLPLDAEAQRGEGRWLGDAEGNPVPFLTERDGLWEPRVLDLDRVLLGQDAAGHPTAEFQLRIPATWRIRDREHLRIELDLEGKAPWVCRAEVQRRLDGGAFLGLTRESPLHVHDLGSAGSSRTLVVPWDAQHYRITLVPTQGKAPTLRSLRVVAATEPREMEADQLLAPADARRERGYIDGERWTVKLAAEERVVGVELTLHPPAAPLQPSLFLPAEEGPGAAPPRSLPVQGLVWNLPALGPPATRLGLDPLATRGLTLVLPPGARLADLKLRVRREVLIYPAEAGRSYFLHLGGLAKPAAGDLGALPPSRMVYAKDPLRLGAAEPDPQGLPKPYPLSRRLRPVLPWAVGVLVLLLAFAAWRLLREAPGEGG